MSRPRGFDLDLDAVTSRLGAIFPTLHVVKEPRGPVIRGVLPIEFEERELDRFVVEIDLKPMAEGKLPEVRETEGRIPRTDARHVNSADGTACVCHPADYLQKNPGPIDLIAFIEGPVRDYFLGQALVERGDPWPHGEWGHGNVGTEQWLDGFLKSLSPQEMEAYVRILALKEMKGHISCPCGSGRRVRNCHLRFLQALRAMVTPEAAAGILARRQRP